MWNSTKCKTWPLPIAEVFESGEGTEIPVPPARTCQLSSFTNKSKPCQNTRKETVSPCFGPNSSYPSLPTLVIRENLRYCILNIFRCWHQAPISPEQRVSRASVKNFYIFTPCYSTREGCPFRDARATAQRQRPCRNGNTLLNQWWWCRSFPGRMRKSGP